MLALAQSTLLPSPPRDRDLPLPEVGKRCRAVLINAAFAGDGVTIGEACSNELREEGTDDVDGEPGYVRGII